MSAEVKTGTFVVGDEGGHCRWSKVFWSNNVFFARPRSAWFVFDGEKVVGVPAVVDDYGDLIMVGAAS